MPKVANRNDTVIDPGILPKRGNRTKQRTEEERYQKGCPAKLDRNGKSVAQKLLNGKVAIDEAGAKIAAEQIAQIAQILLPKRLVEMEDLVEVLQNLGFKRALAVERGRPAQCA